jgi:hypothetical protein
VRLLSDGVLLGCASERRNPRRQRGPDCARIRDSVAAPDQGSSGTETWSEGTWENCGRYLARVAHEAAGVGVESRDIREAKPQGGRSDLFDLLARVRLCTSSSLHGGAMSHT